MENKKLIDLHKEWMETGELPSGGLCYSIPDKYLETFSDHFTPSYEEIGTFWAYPLSYDEQQQVPYNEMAYRYTPTRQTIVLFIACMHNEL